MYLLKRIAQQSIIGESQFSAAQAYHKYDKAWSSLLGIPCLTRTKQVCSWEGNVPREWPCWGQLKLHTQHTYILKEVCLISTLTQLQEEFLFSSYPLNMCPLLII